MKTISKVGLLLIVGVIAFDIWNDGIIFNRVIESYNLVIILLNIVGSILFIIGIFLWNKLKKLMNQTVPFEEEDEHNIYKERIYSNITLCFRIAASIFLFATATGFIVLRDSHPGIVLFAFILLGIIFLANSGLAILMVKMYPERKLGEIESPEDLFDKMDDGEKYVMLKAYYKAYNIVSPVLSFSIMLSALYSTFTGISQIFSIFFMTLLLIAIDVIYLKTVKENM